MNEFLISIVICGVRVVGVPGEDGWVRSHPTIFVIWTRVHSHYLVIRTNAVSTILATANEVEGNLSNKRFATLILTVFGRDNTRMGPVLLFKGKGQVSPKEKLQYAKGVSVFFTPKAVINKPTMDLYAQLWCSKVCHIFEVS